MIAYRRAAIQELPFRPVGYTLTKPSDPERACDGEQENEGE